MARRLTLRSVFLLAMLALVLLGAAVYSVIAYQVRKTDLVQNANVHLLMAGHVARTVTGPGYHDRIADATSISKAEYAHIVATYDELCQQLGLQYIWSLMELDGQIVFTSATHTILTNQHSACATFLEVHTNPEAYRHAFATMQPEFATFHDKWGAGRMVLLPAWDQNHRKHLFAASVQLAGFEALLGRALRESVLVSLVVAALFSLLALLLSRLFTRPLTRLTLAIERMGRGELDHPLAVGGVQELQLLADTFDAMRQTVRQQVGALRDSEERYRSLVENLGIGVTLLSPTMEVLALNRQMREWNPTIQIEGRPLCYCVFNNPPRTEVCSYCPVVKTLQDGEVHEAVTETPRGGSVVNYRIVSSPLKDEAGQVRGVIEMVEDITARKQLEEALRASELRFRALVENTFDAIIVLRPDGTYLYASPATERISGYSQAELLSGNVFTLIHPDDLPGVQQHFQQIVQQPDATAHLDFRARHRDGTWRWVEAHGVNQLTHPAIVGVVVNYRDITGRKQAETALQRSQADLNAIMESTEDIVFLLDAQDGRLQQFNSAFAREAERTYGVRLRVGMMAQDILPAERMPVWAVLFQRVLTTHGSYSTEYLRPSDQKYFEVSFNTIRTEGQLSGVSVFIHDITARKRGEEALRQSEEKYRLVVTALNEGIVVHSAGGEIIACNPAAECILGLTEDQLKGKTSLDPSWRSIHEDGSPFDGEDHPAMVSLRTGKSSNDVVMGVHTPAGELKWIIINTVPVFAAGQPAPHTVIASFADITARKQAEEALQESEALLRGFFDSPGMARGVVEVEGDELRFVSYNSATAQYFGLDNETLCGKTLGDLGYLEAERRWWLAQMEDSRRSSQPVSFEYHHQLAGRDQWFYFTISTLNHDPKGKARFAYTAVDITERKQAEEALRASEAKLQVLFNILPVGISLVDRDHNLLSMNLSLSRILKLSEKEMRSGAYNHRQFLHGDGTPMPAEEIPSVLALQGNCEIHNAEVGVVLEDGLTLWLAVSAAPLPGVGVAVVTRDITAFKQAEEGLRKSQAQLAAVLGSTEDLIWSANAYTLEILSFNAAFAREVLRTYGLQLQLGLSLRAGIPADMIAVWEQLLQRAIHEGRYTDEYFREDNRYFERTFNPIVNTGPSDSVAVFVRDITVRKQAELALVASENRLRSFLDNSAVIAWMKDEEGRYVFVSDNYLRRLNVRREDWLGKTDFELRPRAVAETLRHNDLAVLASGRTMELIEQVSRPDGSPSWGLNSKFLFQDAAGKRYVGGLGVDITARKAAEESLALSQAQLAAVLESTQDMIWSVDAQTFAVLAYNAAFARFILEQFGVTVQPLMTAREILPADRFEFWEQQMQRAIREGPRQLEYPLPGTAQLLEIVLNPIRSGGRVVALSVFAKDISARKQAEEAVRQSEEKYRALIETTNTGYLILDAQGVVIDANEAYVRLTGHAALEEIRGRSVVEWTAPHDRERNAREVAQCLAQGFVRNLEVDYIDSDGKFTPIEINATVMGRGAFARLLALCRDITARKQAEERLRESEAVLRSFFDSPGIHRAIVEIVDDDVRYISVNQSQAELLGYSVAALQGMSSKQIGVPAPYIKLFIERFEESRRTGQPVSFEYERRFAVGSRALIHTVNYLGSGPEGRPRFAFTSLDITARKRAEEALRSSEAQLTSVIESTTDRICTVDVDTLEILSFNTAFAVEMLETYGLHIWAGINMREFLPPERALFWAEYFQRVVQQGRLTLEYFRPNNAKYFEMTFNPIRKDEGVHRLSLFARDITQRRRAELALRASEAKYTRLLTHIEDVLYSVDAVTREFRYLSPAFQKMFGYTLEDIRKLGGRRAFLAYVIQEGQFNEQDDYLQKLQREPAATPFRSVAWWRCKDGTRRYIRDNWMPVYEAGQLVSTEGLLTDLTREKAAEDKLQESEALLKEAQQLAKLGNWSWDVGTDEVTWSDELYDIWGLDRSQPVPSMAQHMKLFPPECWPRVQALLQHARQTGEEYVLETEFLRQDGTRGHLLAHGLSTRDPDGHVRRLYGTAQDVTERKRLQQQLLEISEREQRRIGQDLHDGVGQQLAAMRFQSSTLLQKLAGRRKVTLAEVERLDTMLEETLRQVRDLSRGLHPVSVDSHGLMHGLRELARQSLALFGVPCAFDCADTVLVLDQRAAVNLYRIAQEAVRNAAVHGAPKQIRIQLAEAGGLLRLTIQDDGCGLPPDLKASSGLGLEIMRYRAASIGATCEILSQPGAGVTVQCGWRAPT